ncbi:CHC2 zinc finger domain-containing protein [Clostridium sp.]
MPKLFDVVRQAKSDLGIRAADIINSGLNLDKWDSKRLTGCCPLHSEKSPSFTFNKKSNSFKCFGCGGTMDIIDYYMDHNNMNFIEAAKELFRETKTSYEFEEHKTITPYKYPIEELQPNRGQVEKYMLTRGISKATLDKRNVKQDSKGNIVFEYKDQYGKLMLVKYRPSKKLEKTDIKTWCQKDKDTAPLLFGMDKIDITKPLLITEGECDSLVCIEAGYNNTVSIPLGAGNTHWIEYNWNWLEQFTKIIIWCDSDDAGEKMRAEVIPRLGEARTFIVRSKYKDANVQLFKEGKESIIRSIENAEEIPIKDILDLADTPDFDINKAEKIKSGYAGLDKFISGFVLGSLNTITGINSSGKSTMINQMCVAEPLEQGYKTFIYSGELGPSQLRGWIEFPMAGPQNIKTYDNGPNQPIGYGVPKEVKDRMKEWYRGNIFLYSNEEDTTATSILNKMTEMVTRYGIKNIVLDNLMMIDLGGTEFEALRKQKEFILALKRFARRYLVMIHLIAHPRKGDGIKRLTKMDIAGSGDITNLADYVMAVHRVTPAEKEDVLDKKGNLEQEGCPYDTILDLFKNRHLSHQDKSIGLHFDIKSKRLYGDTDNLNKVYGWNRVIDGVTEVFEPLPF